MQLIRGSHSLVTFEKGVVATIGNFDGVHLGHQNLIKSLKIKADSLGLPLVLIVFEPQPREYFQGDKAPARLSTLRDKLARLKLSDVDYIYCIKFDAHLAQTTATDFANHHLFALLKVKYLLVGQDFRFGKNREGDINLLQELAKKNDCTVATQADFCIEGEKVSSSKIRKALEDGNFKLAADYLGRPFALSGRVLPGDGRGRQWGIPTANLSLHRISLPLHGVFVIQATVKGQTVNGVANLGTRPTVDGTKNVLEVHLFDFNESIYGELMQVFFLHKLRGEVKFTTVDNLIAQIHNDIAAAKDYFNNPSKT